MRLLRSGPCGARRRVCDPPPTSYGYVDNLLAASPHTDLSTERDGFVEWRIERHQLDLLLRTRRAERLLDSDLDELGVVARLAAAVDALVEGRREAGLRLLRELSVTLGAMD